MELYIEKEFLDNFYLDYSDKPIQKKLKMMFTVYGSKQVYIDYRLDEFENFNENNEIFALISSNDKTPIAINAIKEHLFSNSNFIQTLVFTNKEMDWFEFAENKGALCFSFDSYQEKIREIIESCEAIKVDLSQSFPGWQVFEDLKKIPKCKLTINDNFIIENRNHIFKNVVDLIKNITKEELLVEVDIFTNRSTNGTDNGDAICNNFVSSFNDYISLNFNLVLKNRYSQFKFHDRLLYGNIFYIECPIGFNFNTNSISDSIIRVESIFDKFNYDRVKTHIRHLQKVKNSYGQVFSLSTN